MRSAAHPTVQWALQLRPGQQGSLIARIAGWRHRDALPTQRRRDRGHGCRGPATRGGAGVRSQSTKKASSHNRSARPLGLQRCISALRTSRDRCTHVSMRRVIPTLGRLVASGATSWRKTKVFHVRLCERSAQQDRRMVDPRRKRSDHIQRGPSRVVRCIIGCAAIQVSRKLPRLRRRMYFQNLGHSRKAERGSSAPLDPEAIARSGQQKR